MLQGLLILAGTIGLLLIAFMLLERYVKGWRTVVLNALNAIPLIGGAIATEAQALNIDQYLSHKQMLWYLGGVVLANIIFRFGTSSKVGQR